MTGIAISHYSFVYNVFSLINPVTDTARRHGDKTAVAGAFAKLLAGTMFI